MNSDRFVLHEPYRLDGETTSLLAAVWSRTNTSWLCCLSMGTTYLLRTAYPRQCLPRS